MQMAVEKERTLVRTFGHAVRVLRIKAGLSQEIVCQRVGIPIQLLREWESGHYSIQNLHLKKLYTLLPDLKYFTEFLPVIVKEDLAIRARLTSSGKDPLWVPPSTTPADYPVSEKLAKLTFGESLKTAMLDASTSATELRELMDVGDSHVIFLWTINSAVPNEEQYKALLGLFPQLEDCPAPGRPEEILTDYEKRPVKPRGVVIPIGPPKFVGATPPSKLVKIPPITLPVFGGIKTPDTPPHREPFAKQVIKKTKSLVDIAGTEYANAMLAYAHAKAYLEDLKADIQKTEEELEELDRAVKEANKNLLSMVQRTSDELP